MIKVLYKIFHFLLSVYYKNFYKLRLQGPIRGNSLSLDLYEKVKHLRKKRFQESSPHLLYQSESHLDLSRECEHFLCFKGGDLVGSVRFTSFPTEFGRELSIIENLLSKSAELLSFKEISRLVTIGGNKASKPMLTFAALYYIKKMNFKGFVAVCKDPKVSLFKRFGMNVIDTNLVIESRGEGSYNIIGSSFENLTITHLKYIFRNCKHQFTNLLNKNLFFKRVRDEL